MNILHYTIGLPPRRNGGSVQYANNLIKAQSGISNVSVLICGDTLFKTEKCKIIPKYELDGIKVYRLTNPLTPTLIYGTSAPLEQHKPVKIDYDNIRSFIIKNNIEVLHMHTMMGMHSEIVRFIKELGVRVYYTAHDFHGICPHYNLLDYEKKLCNTRSGERCMLCNLHEPSDFFLKIVNSSLYQSLKNRWFIRNLRKNRSASYFEDTIDDSELAISCVGQDYDSLISYYDNYLKLFDCIHFNSNQTRDVFLSFLPSLKGKVINITTDGIKDKRKQIRLNPPLVNIGFIGNLNHYKGFARLKSIIKELYVGGYRSIRLSVYGSGKIGMDEDCPLIEYKPNYTYSELSRILYSLDAVFVPSVCYETFSLVTLESLAHGRPVFVSETVGAKDIVERYNKRAIFSSDEQLRLIFKNILEIPNFLYDYSRRILEMPFDYSMESHVKEIMDFYKN